MHALEPLTADEITAAVAAVRATGRLTDAARFSTITLDEPPKGELATRRAASPPGDRARPRVLRRSRRSSPLASGEVGVVGRARWHAPGPRLRGVVQRHHRPARARRLQGGAGRARHHRPRTRCRSTRGRPGASASPPRTAAASCAASSTTARTRATTATPARSRGCSPRSTWRRGEVLEVVDHGVVPMPDDTGQLLPRGQRAAPRPTCSRSRSPSPTASSFTVDGNLLALAEVVDARVARSARGPRAAHGRLRRRRPHALDPAPRVDQRDGRALRRPRSRATAGRTPSTPASGASGAWPTRSRSAATASARSTTSTPSWPTSRATRSSPPTPSASTRRTTASSGSTSTCSAVAPRCGGRAGSSCRRSPPSATTSTASTGTSTTTARSSSR